MKNIFFILSLVSLLFLASSCPKNDGGSPSNKNPTLPPATQTGANTFGCLLNGKVWIPGGASGPVGIYGFIAQYYKGNFTLSATKKNDTSLITLHWQHINIYKTGSYYFNSNSATNATFIDYDNSYGYATSNADSLQNSIAITRFDTANSVISGTFNFLFTQKGMDTLRITNGRFDVKYTN